MSYIERTKITDSTGNLADVSPYGELHTVEPVRIAGGVFNDGVLDTSFFTSTPTNGGTTTVADAIATLATNTTADGAVKLATAQRARFVGGTTNRFYARIYLGDTGTANNVRRWGLLNNSGTDGIYFKLDNTTLSVNTLKGSVESSTTITPTVTLTDLNLFEIEYNSGVIYFLINNLVVITMNLIAPAVNTEQFFSFIDNTNSGGSTTNVTVNALHLSAYRIGTLETQPISIRITTANTYIAKYGPGLLRRLTIGTPGSTSDTITLYDNTAGSGTIIDEINGPSQANPVTLEYGLTFSTGLTAVSTGTWSAALIFE